MTSPRWPRPPSSTARCSASSASTPTPEDQMTATVSNKKVPAGAATPNGDQTQHLGVGNVGSTVSHTEDIPLLHQMNARGQRIALAYYEQGVVDGIARGRAQVEAEEADRWAWMREHIRSIASTPDYATLAD